MHEVEKTITQRFGGNFTTKTYTYYKDIIYIINIYVLF